MLTFNTIFHDNYLTLYRYFIVLQLFVFSAFCFPQQAPLKIIGGIPNENSAALYQIQVGAFKIMRNAEAASLRLKSANFNPVYEKYLDFTRVIITGLAAKEIPASLEKIKSLGFKEVIIRADRRKPVVPEKREAAAPEVSSPAALARPDTAPPPVPEGRKIAVPESARSPEAVIPKDTKKYDISEKWDIVTPGSSYASFEFNQDNYFIVIENQISGFEGTEQIIHFGEYNMPDNNTIELTDLGEIKINSNTDAGIAFSFTPIDDPYGRTFLEAIKAESIPDSPQLKLFTRTWKIAGSSNDVTVNEIVLFSRAGTYLETEPDGLSWLSEWRWYDEKNEEFEYSHDNWQHYGRAKILSLDDRSLVFNDPGYYNGVEGYSSAGYDDVYELSPMRE
ncbi:MAG: DUF3391 domain-containing protein [Treponema sp.]|jgi:hypothetical protein|nr:DUF3391 domain-containing protein [Treponema sp.]